MSKLTRGYQAQLQPVQPYTLDWFRAKAFRAQEAISNSVWWGHRATLNDCLCHILAWYRRCFKNLMGNKAADFPVRVIDDEQLTELLFDFHKLNRAEGYAPGACKNSSIYTLL
ncbi:uncharacterized protein IUM83_11508 [Phytophthora cinnamomi]|uniref:uncharacterized protein n=1 Tax=Phytophthora cinnamomi TaxID=4785 RepID=UPI00355AA9A9|nr:hypothetical protein IUM83_11508 [Phytophthora cinnamomi]